MDRRKFLKISALSAAGLAVSSKFSLLDAKKKSARKGAVESTSEYSIVILGDTHYDADPVETYHEGYCLPNNPKREANHRKEFSRNSDMWKERCPQIVDRAKRLVDENTKAFLQMGDIVQGDTANAEIHSKFLTDAINFLKTGLGARLPFVTVVGNHDVRGNDDKVCNAAYKATVNARMGAELGQKVESNNFSFRVGPDVFIVIDFNHLDDEEVARLFAESEDARYTFAVIHGPAFPCHGKSYNWFYHGKTDKESRLRMREIFARRNTIVLSGHTHETEFYDWYGMGGRITQMTMSTVWSTNVPAQYKPKTDLAGYTYPGHDELFAEVRDGMKAYSHAHACGCYKLNVGSEGVTVDFYSQGSEEITETFVLR